MAEQETCVSAEEVSIATRYRLELVQEHEAPYDEPCVCDRPESVSRFLSTVVGPYAYEVMGEVMLDSRNRAIEHLVVFMGTLNRAAVEPRGLLVPALLANAAGIILFHSHPSGDPSPSAEDLAFTRRLEGAADVVGVRLVDHLIIGESPKYVSLRQRGGW